MENHAEKNHIKDLISETLTLLCKKGLSYNANFSIEGLLGITLDKEDVFLVNVNQSIDGQNIRDVAVICDSDSDGAIDPLAQGSEGSDIETAPRISNKKSKKRRRKRSGSGSEMTPRKHIRTSTNSELSGDQLVHIKTEPVDDMIPLTAIKREPDDAESSTLSNVGLMPRESPQTIHDSPRSVSVASGWSTHTPDENASGSQQQLLIEEVCSLQLPEHSFLPQSYSRSEHDSNEQVATFEIACDGADSRDFTELSNPVCEGAIPAEPLLERKVLLLESVAPATEICPVFIASNVVLPIDKEIEPMKTESDNFETAVNAVKQGEMNVVSACAMYNLPVFAVSRAVRRDGPLMNYYCTWDQVQYAVNVVREGSLSLRQASDTYDIPKRTLSYWINSDVPVTKSRYTPEQYNAAFAAVKNGQMLTTEAATKYRVPYRVIANAIKRCDIAKDNSTESLSSHSIQPNSEPKRQEDMAVTVKPRKPKLSPSDSYNKDKRTYSAEQYTQAFNAVKGGSMMATEACKMFGIPLSTLCKRLKRAQDPDGLHTIRTTQHSSGKIETMSVDRQTKDPPTVSKIRKSNLMSQYGLKWSTGSTRYTQKQYIESLKAVTERNISYAEASRMYGVPPSTLGKAVRRLRKFQRTKQYAALKATPKPTIKSPANSHRNTPQSAKGSTSINLETQGDIPQDVLQKVLNTRKLLAYTPEQFKTALEAIWNDQVTIMDASRKYGIPRSTLCEAKLRLKNASVSRKQNQNIQNLKNSSVYRYKSSVKYAMRRSRKSSTYSAKQYVQAIESVKCGRMTRKEAALFYGVPNSTIHGAIKRLKPVQAVNEQSVSNGDNTKVAKLTNTDSRVEANIESGVSTSQFHMTEERQSDSLFNSEGFQPSESKDISVDGNTVPDREHAKEIERDHSTANATPHAIQTSPKISDMCASSVTFHSRLEQLKTLGSPLYSKEQYVKAVQAVSEGKMSHGDAARLYGVPKSTITFAIGKLTKIPHQKPLDRKSTELKTQNIDTQVQFTATAACGDQMPQDGLSQVLSLKIKAAYTRQDLKAALEAMWKGDIGVSKASKKYGIPKSTLERTRRRLETSRRSRSENEMPKCTNLSGVSTVKKNVNQQKYKSVLRAAMKQPVKSENCLTTKYSKTVNGVKSGQSSKEQASDILDHAPNCTPGNVIETPGQMVKPLEKHKMTGKDTHNVAPISESRLATTVQSETSSTTNENAGSVSKEKMERAILCVVYGRSRCATVALKYGITKETLREQVTIYRQSTKSNPAKEPEMGPDIKVSPKRNSMPSSDLETAVRQVVVCHTKVEKVASSSGISIDTLREHVAIHRRTKYEKPLAERRESAGAFTETNRNIESRTPQANQNSADVSIETSENEMPTTSTNLRGVSTVKNDVNTKKYKSVLSAAMKQSMKLENCTTTEYSKTVNGVKNGQSSKEQASDILDHALNCTPGNVIETPGQMLKALEKHKVTGKDKHNVAQISESRPATTVESETSSITNEHPGSVSKEMIEKAKEMIEKAIRDVVYGKVGTANVALKYGITKETLREQITIYRQSTKSNPALEPEVAPVKKVSPKRNSVPSPNLEMAVRQVVCRTKVEKVSSSSGISIDTPREHVAIHRRTKHEQALAERRESAGTFTETNPNIESRTSQANQNSADVSIETSENEMPTCRNLPGGSTVKKDANTKKYKSVLSAAMKQPVKSENCLTTKYSKTVNGVKSGQSSKEQASDILDGAPNKLEVDPTTEQAAHMVESENIFERMSSGYPSNHNTPTPPPKSDRISDGIQAVNKDHNTRTSPPNSHPIRDGIEAVNKDRNTPTPPPKSDAIRDRIEAVNKLLREGRMPKE